MQLFAQTSTGEQIFAGEANRQTDYYCLECQRLLRLRGGQQRQLHFYHRSIKNHCHQAAKSIAHLATQLYLQQLLGQENVRLEHPFPEIGRIADVYWPARQLIFEVQCSSITAPEVESRNQDYASVGCQVVWILHDRRFNRARRSAAERLLQHQLVYYTHISKVGEGGIYDQVELLDGSRLPPTSVQLNRPLPKPKLPPGNWPQQLRQRAAKATRCFAGDALHLVSQPTPPAWLRVADKQSRRPARFQRLKLLLDYLISSVIS
jgi:competence protein CoiA